MSAASATDDNNDAAPAATRDLTLLTGFETPPLETDGLTMAPNP